MEDLDCLVQLYDTMAIMDYLAARNNLPRLG